MKKIFKKFIPIVLSVILSISLVPLSAFAANSSIMPEKGNLHIHKYSLKDMDEAGANATGEEITGESEQKLPENAEPLKDIDFKIYKVTAPNGNDKYPEGSPEDWDFTSSPATVVDSNDEEFEVTFIDTITTGADGTATKADLDQGIYLVVEQPSDQVTGVISPFFVSVPMTNPDGDGWLSDVHVYPKNEVMNIEKSANKEAVSVGETVEYALTATVPGNITGDKINYTFEDVLDKSLTFDNTSVSIVAAASKAGLSAGTALAAGDFTVNSADVDGKTKVTISITEAGREKLSGLKYIQIKFDVKVNKNILDNTNYTVENKASVTYQNTATANPATTVETNTVKIHTAAVEIIKTDKNTGDLLPDAEFKIASSTANADAENYLKIDADGNIYDVGDTGYDNVALKDWVLKSDDEGVILFEGVRDFTGMAASKEYLSYYLVETQAPDDYNLLKKYVIATFTAENSTEATDYTINLSVTNTKGFTLPITGGVGAIIFTAAGIALIGAAILLLKGKKKPETN